VLLFPTDLRHVVLAFDYEPVRKDRRSKEVAPIEPVAMVEYGRTGLPRSAVRRGGKLLGE